MNLEHVVNALMERLVEGIHEQNRIAAEILEFWKKSEERNARSEERQIQSHAVVLECGQLAIEREKRMAISDAEHSERMKQLRKEIQTEFSAAPKEEAN